MPVGFLNFQHLYYFWIVAREGGVSHASAVLDLSPSTISAQISQLEKALQVKLFRKVGRNIRLTDVGQIAFRYVDQHGEFGRYPINPNGSIDHIAGLCDATGRVLGMMPHPERFVHQTHHPRWTREKPQNPDGLSIFINAVKYFA